MTGNPYKKEKYFKNVRQLGVVVAIWTFAFLAKFGAAAFGIDMVDVTHTSIESLDDFKSAVFLAI
jgi:hypothetical protein